MEARAALDRIVHLCNECNVLVEVIVADDDLAVCSMLTWSNADCVKNNNVDKPPQVPITKGPNKGKLQDRPDGHGKLPGNIPEPRFASDPNHRKKISTGELHALAKLKVNEKITVTNINWKKLWPLH